MRAESRGKFGEAKVAPAIAPNASGLASAGGQRSAKPLKDAYKEEENDDFELL